MLFVTMDTPIHITFDIDRKDAMCGEHAPPLYPSPLLSLQLKPLLILVPIPGNAVPDGAFMVAMVWYRDEQHQQERGPVARCLKHLTVDCECGRDTKTVGGAPILWVGHRHCIGTKTVGGAQTLRRHQDNGSGS